MPYFLWEGIKVYLIIPHFDPKKELELAEKELNEMVGRIQNLEKQLAKKDFLKKAPPAVIEKLKADYASSRDQTDKLQNKIRELK